MKDKRIGRRFRRLVIRKRVADRHGRACYLCKCDCGTLKEITWKAIRRGQKSCGCAQRESVSKRNYKHGMSGTRLHRIWGSMTKRCRHWKHELFKYYGGRGIMVCKRWLTFKLFAKDMGQPPSDKHTIERINTNGHYEPGNCRWATRKEQGRNKTNNRIVRFDGRDMTLADFADVVGRPYSSLLARLDRGWTPEEAAAIPKFARVHVHRRSVNARS